MTTNETPLAQVLSGIFDELSAKIFKKSLDIPSIERLHTLSHKFAAVILKASERMALVKCKALNDAVGAGFKSVSKDIDALEARIKKLEEKE
jgi:ubiquinone biosynthesis protein UbiJ